MTKARNQQEAWQSAIDWQSFFEADNVPIIGYDPINDLVIIKRGADYGVFTKGVTTNTTSHDLLIYDMRTGAWTKSKNGLANDVDVTNFVVNGNGELVCKASHSSTSTVYKWQPASQATATFHWRSKAFDFGFPALKKKLYKVIIHSKEGDNMDVNIHYDNKTSVSSAADGQEFDKAATPLNNGASLVKNTLSITTPTAFSYLTLEIKSDGTSNAGFEINDITFLYRILRAH